MVERDPFRFFKDFVDISDIFLGFYFYNALLPVFLMIYGWISKYSVENSDDFQPVFVDQIFSTNNAEEIRLSNFGQRLSELEKVEKSEASLSKSTDEIIEDYEERHDLDEPSLFENIICSIVIIYFAMPVLPIIAAALLIITTAYIAVSIVLLALLSIPATVTAIIGTVIFAKYELMNVVSNIVKAIMLSRLSSLF